MIYLFAFVVGLGILYFGAEGTLHGAVGLAKAYGISPLVIGLTLVAYGTSAPELSLDISAALHGSTDLAFGDLVGSNIANIGLILAVAALVRPLSVEMKLLKAEVPIVISISLLLWGLASDGVLSRQDGLILLAGFVLLTAYTIQGVYREKREVQEEFEQRIPPASKRWKDVVYIVVGLVGLIAGAQLMVYGAVGMARAFGLSEMLIGLTIVAIGTSLPELATSIVASLKKEADIVLGNVIGSNIFNLLAVMAIVALIRPIPIPAQAITVELPIMLGFVLLLVPIVLRHRTITRGEGALLLIGYVIFLGWQAISASYGSATVSH